ncbi:MULTISPECIES: hypothetical protein [Clostridium]|uniref:Uncharacterized protein n=3 Tax=Clostridium TaxID=1485 RepID=D8GK18_CLOLD|nr:MULTISPECIES: hypothetical protein [Clostridium]ADK13136.1 hypothetical protein CLJU_c00290 [Clostridium ljungdahlii DSM 13528]AGY76359.1 hypothetical protein CAETHG_2146 [Clostridium autoethanogenum DSM 10061]ALU36522.1 Hypothetical protein CLAU_2093 [Clostridium autoethanogenum DSM 10061]OAA84374.1 hypothetical protein WX45_01037 [Clostridium ljungdahlii DSM 13528]OVY48608.1 hypothetical protein WX72_00429 [Clostridium autoethanogenum]
MNDDSINYVLDNYKGVRRDRALKIISGQLKETDLEFKQYVKNELVRDRKTIIEQYKNIEGLHEVRKACEREYKYYEKINDVVNKAEFQLNISEVDKLAKEILRIIATLGEHFIDVLSLNILEEHDVCQLLNINWKIFKNNKQAYIKQFGEKDKLVYKVISVMGPEYRYRKGRMKEIYDCPKYEMPVYWAMNERIMQEVDNNKELKKLADEAFEKLFPDVKTYRVVKDLEGNVIKVVEETEKSSSESN